MAWLGKSVVGALLVLSLTIGVAETADAQQRSAQGAADISKTGAAKQYLADATQVNATINTAGADLNVATTPAQSSTAVKLLEASLHLFDTAVDRQRWPTTVRADVRSLMYADGVLEADYSSLSRSIVDSSSSLESTLSKDESAVSYHADLVRGDLGLPPPMY